MDARIATTRLRTALTAIPRCRTCLAQTTGIPRGEIARALYRSARALQTIARVRRCVGCGNARGVVYAMR
jgi:hypothetical protein